MKKIFPTTVENTVVSKSDKIKENELFKNINSKKSFSSDEIDKISIKNELSYMNYINESRDKKIFKIVSGELLNYVCCTTTIPSADNGIFPFSYDITKRNMDLKKLKKDISEVHSSFKSSYFSMFRKSLNSTKIGKMINPTQFGMVKLPSEFECTSCLINIGEKDLEKMDAEKKISKEYEFFEVVDFKSKLFKNAMRMNCDVVYGFFKHLRTNDMLQQYIESWTIQKSNIKKTKNDKRDFRCLTMLNKEDKSNVASILMMYIDEHGVCSFFNICTHPSHRRKGLCSKLLIAAAKIAKKDYGCKYVTGMGTEEGMLLYKKFDVQVGDTFESYANLNYHNWKFRSLHVLLHLVNALKCCC